MNIYLDIFYRFLYLGFISFGGPAAHIGYFQKVFVEKYQWLNNKDYASVVALSQFLPGPGSSQVGFTLGYQRAGLIGGVAAFLGFTLPSFVLMVILGTLGSLFIETDTFLGVVNGLKLLAVIVVADAILSMSRSFCQHHITRLITIVTAILLLCYPSIFTQVLCMLFAGIFVVYFRNLSSTKHASEPNNSNEGKQRVGLRWPPLIAFLLMLMSSVLFVFEPRSFGHLFSEFYQSGSFVFGGGHVVLPLLQQTVGDSLTSDQFLTGYALAQAIPGPMFTLAAYLGTQLLPNSPIIAASIACLAIFLPGFLLIIAFQKSWQILSTNTKVTNAMMGVNAAVVGLLLAAFYQPVMLNALHSWVDAVLAIGGFILLKYARLPIVALVILYSTLGVIRVIA